MTVPMVISGLWRGLAVASAHAAGEDAARLLAMPSHKFNPSDPASVAAALMRNRASYVAVVGFGLPMTRLSAEIGINKQTISKALRHIEDCREDPAHDRLLLDVADLFGVQL